MSKADWLAPLLVIVTILGLIMANVFIMARDISEIRKTLEFIANELRK